jgi:hypothetical protein
MLPFRYFIDYEALLLKARQECAADLPSFLQQCLPSLWRDAYLSAISHEPNFVRFRHRTFEYICDIYSQLEITGSVPYDQTIADRVIGVCGTSARANKERYPRSTKVVLTEELEGTARDDGHFIARSIGGDLDVNLFSQDRLLNRGWSAQGKIYRRMEKYCQQQEGTKASRTSETREPT